MNGLCECGCGGLAPISKVNRPERGQVKGQPVRFIKGHQTSGLSNGRRTHCLTKTVEHQAWRQARSRCTDSNRRDWMDYGGRGIKCLLPPFVEFLAALGPRPAGMSLDRINNDGNYEIGNVRWATAIEQRHNQRRSAA